MWRPRRRRGSSLRVAMSIMGLSFESISRYSIEWKFGGEWTNLYKLDGVVGVVVGSNSQVWVLICGKQGKYGITGTLRASESCGRETL